MLKKHSFILTIALVLVYGVVPGIVIADAPTGKEPWSAAFMEANPDGVQGYVIKNLVNSEWQDGLNIWWRANIPCGTFTGSGLSATWDRSACAEAGAHGSIAIFIENTKVSGKEYPYPDHLGAPAKYPPEHLIVYAEYPEEGRKHGFGTSLLYYGYDVFLKYNPAKEGTTNTNPLPNLWGTDGKTPVTKQAPAATPVSVQTEQTPSKDGGVPWVPIAIAVAVLGSVAYYFRSSLNLNRLSIFVRNHEYEEDREEIYKLFDRDICMPQYVAWKDAQMKFEDMALNYRGSGAIHGGGGAHHNLDGGGYHPNFEKSSSYVDPLDAHADLLGKYKDLDDAREKLKQAKEAFYACKKRAFAKGTLGDKAPADYAKPEGEPEDPDVM